jgi:RND family efflux transporter MFP subunit
MNYHVLAILLIISLISCNNTSPTAKVPEKGSTLAEAEKPKVSVIDLKAGVFYKEVLSNGKLYAIRKADLKFRVSEVIDKINVKNGDIVEKGAVIAILNSYTYNLSLQRAHATYDKSKVDMQDVLMGQGYQTIDSIHVPAGIWKMAKTKSGVENALFDLQSAQYDLYNTVLHAPFRGIVCNLKMKENNMATTDAFCTLVDNSIFEASFQVLESELGNITLHQPVTVVPYAVDSTGQSGVVSEINPLVDDNGLVTVKAKVTNTHNNLYEGMNVRVVLRKAFTNCLVVPKSAVVLRTGKEVVFTLENGLAKWNYVKTGDENTNSFTITEGLKAGCTVIVSGNLNLGHDAEVIVINNERIKN